MSFIETETKRGEDRNSMKERLGIELRYDGKGLCWQTTTTITITTKQPEKHRQQSQ